MQTLRLPILLFSLCGLAITAVGQQGREWRWKDRDGVERTRAELDEILAEHKKYVASRFKEGKAADLSGTGLQGANLRGAGLRGANLRGAGLQGANLISANLQAADLTLANLQRADLVGADLQGADLTLANLQGANLTEADVEGADLAFANLQGAIMTEVQGLPEMTWLASAKGLSTIIFWPEDIHIFVTWKKILQEAGYTRASKALVAAIRRNNQPEL